MKPLLRWAGSKTKLLPLLSTYWRPDSKRYIEAFVGSASLFFHLDPKRASLNDLNGDLVNAYEHLKQSPERLYQSVVKIPNNAETYYAVRSSLPETVSKLDRAIKFFYLNRYCFNGIYRTNSRGEFNVPFANRGTGGVPELDRWLQCAKALKKTELSSEDFERFLLRTVKKGDFVYLDPPYAASNRRIFSQYSAQTFGEADLRRLASTLEEIDRRGATFVVSYAQSPETKILANGWFVRRTFAQRNVAGFSRHRRKALEVIISNFELDAV